MITHELVLYPDPRLRQKIDEAGDVTDILRLHSDEMLATMYKAKGIGLAAPQIGRMERLIVMDCAVDEEKPDPLVMINPRIEATSEEARAFKEGCLSFPEMTAEVTRPSFVTVSWLDGQGKTQRQDFDGLRAVCVQHEIDHLNGRLFIDHITRLRRDVIVRKMKKLKRELAG